MIFQHGILIMHDCNKNIKLDIYMMIVIYLLVIGYVQFLILFSYIYIFKNHLK